MPDSNHSGIRRVITSNIGTIIFGILFIYIVVSVLMFMTAHHVASYQVTSGPLAKNQTYTGLAVRSEQVVTTDTPGYIVYYAAENTRVRKSGVVYGISAEETTAGEGEPGEETLRTVQDRVLTFAENFDPSDFYDTYSLKYQIEGDLLNSGLSTLPDSALTDSVTVNGQTINLSSDDGIVCYSTDGYENVDMTQLNANLFDEKAYSFQSLKTSGKAAAGDPVYKLVNSENWSLLIPLTARQIVKLSDLDSVKVKFMKDGATETAAMTILTGEDGNYYGRLDFTSGLIRYIGSRFLKIELVTNDQVGLKIPVSSITSKSFFLIPDSYAASGGDTTEIGFMKLTTTADGSTVPVFTTTTLYEHKNGFYYVDSTAFQAGDVIVKAGAEGDRYIIRDTDTLEGVYNVNKGYAVFRKIEILDKNEDYCIVAKGTAYGIAQFDNIVLDASKVKESEITAVTK